LRAFLCILAFIREFKSENFACSTHSTATVSLVSNTFREPIATGALCAALSDDVMIDIEYPEKSFLLHQNVT